MSKKNDNDNVIQLFPKDLPHINNAEGRITYNPHRLLIRDDDEPTNKNERLRRSLEKINQLMKELRGDNNA